MNRRTFLIAGSGVIFAGLAGGYVAIGRGDPNLLSITSVFERLDALSPTAIAFSGNWSASHIFHHMAQSIELSMSGYPVHKSDLFKSTVGPLAFSVFAAKGKMKHNLEEDIPGAPVDALAQDVAVALQRFRSALETFEAHTGDLQPHFAYGPLTKEEYRLAHVLHFNNHLERLNTPS